MNKVLITGITGLIGSFIARKLLEDGYEIKGLYRDTSDLTLVRDKQQEIEWVKGDITDLATLREAFAGVDYVIHSAAIVSFSTGFEVMKKVNVEGTANVVNLAQQFNIKKLCFISSVAAIGRTRKDTHIHEDMQWKESELNTDYAVSKHMAELEVWRSIEEGLPAVIVNPSVVLGPGKWNESSVQLFSYVWNQNKFYPKGTINFVDVRDVTEAVSRLTFSDISGERFILNGGCMSYKAFFEEIAGAFTVKAPSVQITPFLGEVMWRLEKVRSTLVGKNPALTRQTARLSALSFEYSSTKIMEWLNGFSFYLPEDTINWCCENLLSSAALKNDKS